MQLTTQTVTLNLPDPLYQRLQEGARQIQLSVEEAALMVLATAVPIGDDLSADLTEAISTLSALDDAALWQAARSRFLIQTAQHLEALHHKHQREGQTEAEAQMVEPSGATMSGACWFVSRWRRSSSSTDTMSSRGNVA
jgi:hypothetical protein